MLHRAAPTQLCVQYRLGGQRDVLRRQYVGVTLRGDSLGLHLVRAVAAVGTSDLLIYVAARRFAALRVHEWALCVVEALKVDGSDLLRRQLQLTGHLRLVALDLAPLFLQPPKPRLLKLQLGSVVRAEGPGAPCGPEQGALLVEVLQEWPVVEEEGD